MPRADRPGLASLKPATQHPKVRLVLDALRLVVPAPVRTIRYLDEFVKQDGDWLFAERRLMADWTETRPSAP